MVVLLSKTYASCFGNPKADRIDTEVFNKTYTGMCFNNQK